MLPYLLLIWLVRAEAGLATKVAKPVSEHPIPPGSPDSSKQLSVPVADPGRTTFFSVYAGNGVETRTIVPCRLVRAANNIEPSVTLLGRVDEDIVSNSGKVLLPAGTKVSGNGYCDVQTAKVLGRGHWTFYLKDRQITVAGALRDKHRTEGLPGEENDRTGESSSIRQAIYRDGVYLYLPIGTEFLLDLEGKVQIDELPDAGAPSP